MRNEKPQHMESVVEEEKEYPQKENKSSSQAMDSRNSAAPVQNAAPQSSAQEPATEKWLCNNCFAQPNGFEYWNDVKNAECTICQTPKPVKGQWQCKACTSFNSDFLPYCESCKAPKN